MHLDLTESLKRRMILELREFWAKDPKYKDTLTGNIQGKYSFEEEPQQAIVLKSASATPIRFSADNYQGILESYVSLYKVSGKHGSSIEWVREDARQIQRNGGTFPAPPGVYYIEVRREPLQPNDIPGGGLPGEYLVFYVDPLLQVINETPTMISPTIYDVGQGEFHQGSLVVYEMPGSLQLYEGVNYTADPATGRITLTAPSPSGTYLSVDYYYVRESTGPFPLPENGANNRAIPGVVLVFGRRAHEGDVMAVLVTERREDAAREFGGRYEMSLDLDVMARDVHAQGEITDRTLSFIHAELRDRLSFEGIEIDSVSHSGESEEQYDDVGDEFYYTASISITVLTNWAIYLPLGPPINRVIQGTLEAERAVFGLSDDQIAETGNPQGLRLTEALGLVSLRDPWFKDRRGNFETIR